MGGDNRGIECVIEGETIEVGVIEKKKMNESDGESNEESGGGKVN